jgi:hypothetical protein
VAKADDAHAFLDARPVDQFRFVFLLLWFGGGSR